MIKSIPGVTAIELQRAFAASRRFLRRPYVTGVSIGEAYRGEKSDGLAVRLHVEQKLPEKLLTKAQRFPKSIEGVPIDVVERRFMIQSGNTHPASTPESNGENTLAPGQKIVVQGLDPGTAGMIVSRTSDPDNIFLLTAGHVLNFQFDEDVFQPHRALGAPIGHIHDCLMTKRSDAGIIALDSDQSWTNVPLELNSEIVGVREVRIGDILVKSGMMTGITYAEVKEVAECKVQTSEYSAKKMVGMILKPLEVWDDPFCDQGDSGSIWYDEESGLAVGLHVGGDDNGTGYEDDEGFACNLIDVMDDLGLNVA